MQVRLLPLSLYLALSTVTLVCLPAFADQCDDIKANIAKIQKNIDYEEAHQYLPCCKPGLPPKPVKDPEDIKLLEQSRKEMATAEQQLKVCNTPPPVPGPKVAGFTASGMGVPDPQIAVGHKYFVAIDTSYFGFYKKSNQAFAPAPFDHSQSFGSMFSSFYKTIDEATGLPTWLCDPNNTALVFKDPPKNTLIKNNFGCIAQAYDARVVYDASRKRFWIASAVRPFLWTCTTKGGKPGVETNGTGGRIWDPDPSDPTGQASKCHSDWKQSWVHRFIVVAISQTDSNGNEDLSKPFHKYALADTFGDWPQMSVNDDYLVLDHFDTDVPDRDPVEVFNSKKLADGVLDNTALKVKPVKTLALSSFVVGSGNDKVPAHGGIFLVNQHGSSNGMTYLIAANGHKLLIFGLKSPSGNPGGTPTFVKGAAIDLGHDVGSMRNNATFRDGKLYIAAFFCEDHAGKDCDKYGGRIYRVPVHLSADGESVRASGPGEEGFMDYIVGRNSDGWLSYENTMIEVTKDRDMVYGFEGVGLRSDHREPAAIKYAIFYHDKGNISDNGTILHHHGNAMPDPPDPGQTGGIIDLGGIALDPSDERTVWISHGYSKDGKYTEGVGAVKP